jgi:glutathione S-transferase
MKLYDGGRAPNPRRVRIFCAEKNIPLPDIIPIDLNKGEHKSLDFGALNPALQVPVLVLDDGTPLSETMAICRYLEALYPQPPLFGAGAKDVAIIEMWNRRSELGLYTALQHVFRHSHPGMAELEKPQLPDWAEANRPRAIRQLHILNEQLAQHRFLTGDAFTVADITAGIATDFLKVARIAIPEDCTHLMRWHAELRARPSWSA